MIGRFKKLALAISRSARYPVSEWSQLEEKVAGTYKNS
jgi:hypothetical protein